MNFRTTGIILKKRDFGEADKILTILTPGRGRVEAIARGVRKIKARFAGHLEMFYCVDLDLREGKTWYVITGAETIAPFSMGDLELFKVASKAGRRVMQLAQSEQENPKLYYLLEDFLRELSSNNCALDLLLTQFEWQLLLAGGFSPKIKNCAKCSGTLSKDEISFCAQAGGALCVNCRQTQLISFQVSENTYKAFRLFEHAPLSMSGKISNNSINNSELRKVNKMFWEYYLDYSLE